MNEMVRVRGYDSEQDRYLTETRYQRAGSKSTAARPACRRLPVEAARTVEAGGVGAPAPTVLCKTPAPGSRFAPLPQAIIIVFLAGANPVSVSDRYAGNATTFASFVVAKTDQDFISRRR